MDYLRSDLSAKAYLSSLRTIATLNFALWEPYASGIVIGPFFALVYYSPYEWNRRITRECNRAWGIVKDTGDGCAIQFIRGKGQFSPLWLIAMTLLCRFMLGFGSGAHVFTEFPWLLWVISAGAALVSCGITAIESSVTNAGMEGAAIVTTILRAPHKYGEY